jgi:hypothetical protein
MSEVFYPGELDAAAEAMQAKRRELIGQPLERIWRDLAMAGLLAAEQARMAYLDVQLTEMLADFEAKVTNGEAA